VSRVVVLAAMVAFLPPACAKLVGKQPPPQVEPEVAPPPPPPISSATTPPAWHPPEPPASSSAAPSTQPPSADLVKARAAADAKDFKKVRTLLEKKVRGGKCAPEEAQLVLRACTVLKDKACVAEVTAKHSDATVESR
jgi:hypothetical protein